MRQILPLLNQYLPPRLILLHSLLLLILPTLSLRNQPFPVFHVSLLEPAYENEFTERNIPTPKPIILNGEKEYEVEYLDSKKFHNKIKYLIHWKGYDDSENSWELFENLHCNKLLAEFHKKFPNKPKLKTSGIRL